jgi:hypothetical protein
MTQLFVIKLTLENEDDGLFIPQHERSNSPHSPMPLLTPTKQPSPVLVSGFNTLSAFIIIIVFCFRDLNKNSNSHYPQENKSLSTLCVLFYEGNNAKYIYIQDNIFSPGNESINISNIVGLKYQKNKMVVL